MTYLERLARELTSVGIRGRRQTRILAEFADHLESDPQADLGDPSLLARQFGDELGTALARRAAFTSFAALAVAGALLAVAWLTQQGALAHGLNTVSSPLGDFSGLMVVVAPQVAFVAGLLAVLRAWKRRAAPVIPRAEAVVIMRRAGLGVGAGLMSMAGLGLMAVALRNVTPGWWLALAWSAAGVGMVALLAATPAVRAAGSVQPVAVGDAGDLTDDFGSLVPSTLLRRPWWFALATAGAVAVIVAVAGVAAADPFDGMLRGVADGVACLAGFGLLGRYLALR